LRGFATLALVAALCAGCQQNRAPATRFVQQAERLHDRALAATITPDEDLNAYVHEIGKRLEQAAREVVPDKARPMRFHLVDIPIINVYSTGGAHLYVYRGLFDFCNTEEELAAAMAHAYAHALNLDTEGTGMNPPEGERPLRAVAWDYVVNRFAAQQEQESDKLAFRLYARAGWDPGLFEVLFSRLSDVYPGPPAPDRQPLATRGAQARFETAGVPRKWRQMPVADPRTYGTLRKQATGLRSANTNEGRLYLLAFPNCILSRDLPEQQRAQDLLRPPPPPAVEIEPN
jgi:hypothetical protein